MPLMLYALPVTFLAHIICLYGLIKYLVQNSAGNKKIARRFLVIGYLAAILFIIFLFIAVFDLAGKAGLL